MAKGEGIKTRLLSSFVELREHPFPLFVHGKNKMIEIEFFIFIRLKEKCGEERMRNRDRKRERERERNVKRNEGTEEPCVLSSSLIGRERDERNEGSKSGGVGADLRVSRRALIGDNRRGLCYRPGSAGWIVLSRVRYSPSRRERLKGGEWRGVSVHRDQQDPGYQNKEKEDLPHPSARHVAHHSCESAKRITGEILLFFLSLSSFFFFRYNESSKVLINE